MTLQEILEKRSIQYQSEELPRLRRRICKKSFEIFYQEKKMDKNESKCLALVLENMINTKFNHT